MNTLGLEERTVGYVLRIPLFNGATYGSHAHQEMQPFLDRPGDFEIVKTIDDANSTSLQDVRYQELIQRNPFLVSLFNHETKFLLQRAVKNGFSVADSLLQSARTPYDLATPAELLPRLSSSDLAHAFLFYHLLAAEMGIADAVREGMAETAQLFSAAVEEAYQRHVVRDEPFSYADLDRLTSWQECISKDAPEEAQENFRKLIFPMVSGETKKRINLNLSRLKVMKKTLDLDFCRTPNTDALIEMLPGDWHILKTMATLKPESLQSYVERYGFNFNGSYI